jgi:hypothetical protein
MKSFYEQISNYVEILRIYLDMKQAKRLQSQNISKACLFHVTFRYNTPRITYAIRSNSPLWTGEETFCTRQHNSPYKTFPPETQEPMMVSKF